MALHHPFPLNFECSSAPSTKAARRTYIYTYCGIVHVESLHSHFQLNKMPSTFSASFAVLIVPVYVDSVAILMGSIDKKLRRAFNKDRDEVGVQQSC